MDGLQIADIVKTFGKKQALSGVSFEVHKEEIVAVLGPSGCGKSTLLSIVAGLEAADSGSITWEGVAMDGIPPYRRGFGLMFQDFALFPHQNVYENVAFGLHMQHAPEEQIRQQVHDVLELVGLPGFEPRDVNTLSGGEQQRVALARSLAPRPRLLMLDEPLGSLDRTLRERLVLELREILRRFHQTALYITHDQEEAFVMADRLVVMNAGTIEQIGTPQAIFSRPASLFVARFLGLNNLLQGEVVTTNSAETIIETVFGRVNLPTGEVSLKAGEKVTLLMRPDTVSLGERGAFQLHGSMAETFFRGSVTRATISAQEIPLTFDFPNHDDLPAPGQAVVLSFDPAEALQILVR